jgi:hypothetical protein
MLSIKGKDMNPKKMLALGVSLSSLVCVLYSSVSLAVIGVVPPPPPQPTHQNQMQAQNKIQGNRGGDQIFGPGDGHDVPTPFDIRRHFNQRVELADGEKYLLWGDVKRPYFKVDLHEHPWLKSSSGLQKYYLLDGTEKIWEADEGQHVQLFCKAHVRKVKLEDGREDWVIALERLK